MAVASRRMNLAASEIVEPFTPIVAERTSSANARYARDPFAHVEDGHIVILDLESRQPVLLEPWAHQEELTRDWIDLDYLTRTGTARWRNVHEIKSRQMGITWWVAYLYAWALRWHPARHLALSLKVSEIADSGLTVDSFFGRVRFIAEYVDPPEATDPLGGWPDHLRPRFAYAGGNDPVIRGQAGGFLAGAGATPDPGRGGGYESMFLDEFARVPYGESVQAAVTRACPEGRLYNSTVEGEDNSFWRIREARPAGYRFRRDHWSRHEVYGQGKHVAAKLGDDGAVEIAGDPSCPLCVGTLAGLRWKPNDPLAHRYPGQLTSPWFERAIVDLTDPQVASELNIDPTAALTARIYPEFSEEIHVAAIEIPLLPNVDPMLGWDYGFGTTSVVIVQDTPREWRIVGEVELHDALPETVARAVRAELKALGMSDNAVAQAATLGYICRGDPAGEAPEQGTGRSIVEDYRREGFSISSQQMRLEPSIRSVKRLLGGRPKDLVVSQRCPLFIHHHKHYRREVDRQGNPKPDAKPDKKHGHDHMPDAHRYLYAWAYPAPDIIETLQKATRESRPSDAGKLDAGLSYDTAL